MRPRPQPDDENGQTCSLAACASHRLHPRRDASSQHSSSIALRGKNATPECHVLSSSSLKIESYCKKILCSGGGEATLAPSPWLLHALQCYIQKCSMTSRAYESFPLESCCMFEQKDVHLCASNQDENRIERTSQSLLVELLFFSAVTPGHLRRC